MADAQVLNSWKEIAQYVGRSVRTVQRWESQLRFPVRRVKSRDRGAVMALRAEIDLWLSSRPCRTAEDTLHGDRESLRNLHESLVKNTERATQLSAAALALQSKIKALQEHMISIRDRNTPTPGNHTHSRPNANGRS